MFAVRSCKKDNLKNKIQDKIELNKYNKKPSQNEKIKLSEQNI